MPRYLTKSRFNLAAGCPTKLFYTGKDEYKCLLEEDSFMQMLAEGGFQVGELAKLMYPKGHEIRSLRHADALEETREKLKQKNVVLFEPAILYKDYFIRIDILVKRGNRLELIEVKAKSYDSDSPDIEKKRGGISSGMLSYLQDVAFQTYVLRKAYPDMTVTSYLMMPDKAKAATIDRLNQYFKIQRAPDQRTRVVVDPAISEVSLDKDLLALVKTDEWVEQILNTPIHTAGKDLSFPAAIKTWAKAYKKDTEIPPVIGSHCRGCEFYDEGNLEKSGFHRCWKQANGWTNKDFKDDLILDLWNFRRKEELIQKGVLKLKQVTQEDLRYKESDKGLSQSQRQWMQVDGIPEEHKADGFYLDISMLAEEMRQWKHPFHCIDFETAAVALPFNKGLHPYESVAFQFSHHVIRRSGKVEHKTEFLLAEPGVFPNYEFVRALKGALENDNGSVFMWAPHERTILRAIARQLQRDENPPKDAAELLQFIDSLTDGDRALIDLCTLAGRASFYPSSKGSNSIKKVLPAVLNTSDFLKQKYSQPVYGASKGIKSLNYADHVWWQADADGSVIDPYDQLKSYARQMLGDDTEEILDEEHFEIAEGGAAASAYARLQFEDISQIEREAIRQALLRYCELDTLAMVMIVEAWLAELRG